MTTLSHGLNITKKSSSSSAFRPPPKTRKTIFDDDSGPEDGPDNEEAVEVLNSVGGIGPSSKTQIATRKDRQLPLQPPSRRTPQMSQYGDLSTKHSTNHHTNIAQSLDPDIYDYDSVYDSLHAKMTSSISDTVKGPKYMANLLAAAEVRKRDQLRAKEKMLLKEREAEGEEFAGKESFVTDAYKAQQEEVRKVEEEETKREAEEEDRKRKGGGGMAGLYKKMLERDEQKFTEQMKAAEEAKGKKKVDELIQEKEKTEIDLAKEKGAVINDEGEIVDKRQLLNAGLNVAPKPQSLPNSKVNNSPSQGFPRSGDSVGFQSRIGSKQAMRERQTRMLETQLEEASKRAANDEDVQREAMERAAKSQKTKADISSAKERYLQRKKEAVEVAASNKGT